MNPHPLCSESSQGWQLANTASVWTGFFGGIGTGTPRWYPRGDAVLPPTSVGCRVLGQAVDDQFGTAVASDGTWLYISAPERTALMADVPDLATATPAGDRMESGVVYMLPTDVRTSPTGTNQAQLWIEPGTRPDPNDPNTLVPLAYPYGDAEISGKVDYTMPVPHQFIVETVGSWRGYYGYQDRPYPEDVAENDCGVDPEPEPVSPADYAYGIPTYYQSMTAGNNVDRTPQIVGPHVGAKISFVRGLGYVDQDSNPDFAVGSEYIQEPDPNDADYGNGVGAIYVLPGRPFGGEGDYLLENVQLAPSAENRLRGLMLKGSSTGERLARVFDAAGDFNGDGYDDVIVGNDAALGGKGEAIIIFGAPNLTSPQYGWTVDGIVAAGKAIRFTGPTTDEQAGANVAGAGDVDADGYADVLIAAPGALGGKGAVYLIYGSDELAGEIDLSTIGTVDLPGARFIGRQVGDQVGGGTKIVGTESAYSRGVARLGDIDGDGRDDIALSAMLADPRDNVDAGETYVIYGRGD